MHFLNGINAFIEFHQFSRNFLVVFFHIREHLNVFRLGLQYVFVVVPDFSQVARLLVDEVVDERVQTVQLGVPLLHKQFPY